MRVPPSWRFSKVCRVSPSCIGWSWQSTWCVEVGACGMRLVCLLLQLTGRHRFVGASYGMQHHVNRRGEEAIVASREDERARLAREMPANDSTMAHDATFTGGLSLVGIEPVSNSIV